MADVDFSQFGVQLGTQLGIGDTAGGILMSLIFMCLFLFPVLLLCRKNPAIPAVIVGIGTECACIGFQWLPIWVLFVTALLVFGLIASKARDWITGTGGGN